MNNYHGIFVRIYFVLSAYILYKQKSFKSFLLAKKRYNKQAIMSLFCENTPYILKIIFTNLLVILNFI